MESARNAANDVTADRDGVDNMPTSDCRRVVRSRFLADRRRSLTHEDMNTTEIAPVALATCVEHSLNLSLSGFDLKRARLYGINVVDPSGVDSNSDGALRISFLAEHGDVYELLESRGSSIARMFDAAAVLTCGWAAPVDEEDESEVPPSVHPRRRRVRLVVVVGDSGVGSVLRFADTPEEIVTDPGNAKGSLADAVERLWRDPITSAEDADEAPPVVKKKSPKKKSPPRQTP